MIKEFPEQQLDAEEQKPSNNSFEFKVIEIVGYNELLTEEERRTVRTGLANKYGIKLEQNN